jgi:hypothetical protein
VEEKKALLVAGDERLYFQFGLCIKMTIKYLFTQRAGKLLTD